MRLLLLIVLNLWILTACTSNNSALDGDLIELSDTAFKKAYLIENKNIDSVEAHLFILSGEADNQEDEGMAHYLEHLVWLNITKDGHKNHQQHSNAFTTQFSTQYWLSDTVKNIDTTLAKIAEVFSPIDLPQNKMDEELGIIQREYDLRVTDQLLLRAQENQRKFLYNSSGLARSVLGDKNEIASFTSKSAKDLHRKTHLPENSFLLLYGNIDRKTATKKVSQHFSSLKGSKANLGSKELTLDNDYKKIRDMKSYTDENKFNDLLSVKKLVKLETRYSIPELAALRIFFLELMNSNLEGGLTKPLRNDDFIAQSLNVELNMINNRYLQLDIQATPDKGIILDDLLAQIETMMAMISEKGVPSAVYERLKNRILLSMENIEDIPNYNRSIAIDMLTLHQPPFSATYLVKNLQDITLPKLNTFVREIFDDHKTSIALIRAK